MTAHRLLWDIVRTPYRHSLIGEKFAPEACKTFKKYVKNIESLRGVQQNINRNMTKCEMAHSSRLPGLQKVLQAGLLAVLQGAGVLQAWAACLLPPGLLAPHMPPQLAKNMKK